MPRDPKMRKARSGPKEKAADPRVTRKGRESMCKLFGGVEDILPTPNRVIDAPFDCMLVAYKDSKLRIRIAVCRLHLKRRLISGWDAALRPTQACHGAFAPTTAWRPGAGFRLILHVCAHNNFPALAGTLRGVCGWAYGRPERASGGPASQSNSVGAV